MKKMLLLFCLGLLFGLTTHAEDPDEMHGPPGLGRGISNVLLCWWELPRGVVYEFQVHPVSGLVWGPVKGLLLTSGRIVSGTADLVSYGYAGDLVHSAEYPSFVWEAEWIPAK